MTERPFGPVPDGMPADVVAVGPTSGLQYVRPTPAMAHELERLELEAFPTADPAELYDAVELEVPVPEAQGLHRAIVGRSGAAPGRRQRCASTWSAMRFWMSARRSCNSR